MSFSAVEIWWKCARSLAALALAAALPLWCQYPGQVAKTSKDAPELRSIAVLEFTGDAANPTASRLVPVLVFDGGQLQDGGIYMARPEPLALTGEVEYQLESGGQPVRLFDVKNTGQEQGSWVGYGALKPLPVAKPAPSQPLAESQIDDAGSDQPVLHRKKHGDEAPAKGNGKSGSTTPSTPSSAPAPAADPDRPTLHKKSSSGDTADSGAHASASPSEASAKDPQSAPDPDRPTLKKSHKKPPEDIGHVDSLPQVTDADRPRLIRGKPAGKGLDVLPSLMGLPPEMQQQVAVSDTRNRPEHPWSYTWADAADEDKMKAALEAIARDALGLNPPAAPKRTAPAAARKNAKPASPPAPSSLTDERFRVFELAYGAGATLVLSTSTDAPLPQRKYLTLIAQPDFYGNPLVLLKSVTDGSHLDDNPRMRLVDAVDALADNRGELLFELRGSTQRQFALYRILRGQAEKLFATGGGEFGKAE